MKEFKSFYISFDDRKHNTWCKYTKRLDTYGCGCQHDCSYCYSKSLLSFRGLWNAANPLVANINDIERQIKKIDKGSIVKLGGMTDCFMPIELKYRNTYKTIMLLNKYKIHYLIVTKSSIVSDLEYLSIYDKTLAHFQITLTSTNDLIGAKYEKSSLQSNRIKSIETLYKNGFDVSVRLSPFIFQFLDFDILNKINCNKILVEFLKVNHWVKKWFDIDYSQYNHKYGGYTHLPLQVKINQLKMINGFQQVSIGEYVKEHHEYFKNNVNFNKSDCCNIKGYNPMVTTQLKLF